MKRLIMLLAALIAVFPLSIAASAAETAAADVETASVQPRLTGEEMLTLGNAWVYVDEDTNWFPSDLTVTNHADSAHPVMVRILSKDGSKEIKPAKKIEAGYSYTFYSIPADGYVIQAKSADDEVRMYTLIYMDQFSPLN